MQTKYQRCHANEWGQLDVPAARWAPRLVHVFWEEVLSVLWSASAGPVAEVSEKIFWTFPVETELHRHVPAPRDGSFIVLLKDSVEFSRHDCEQGLRSRHRDCTLRHELNNLESCGHSVLVHIVDVVVTLVRTAYVGCRSKHLPSRRPQRFGPVGVVVAKPEAIRRGPVPGTRCDFPSVLFESAVVDSNATTLVTRTHFFSAGAFSGHRLSEQYLRSARCTSVVCRTIVVRQKTTKDHILSVDVQTMLYLSMLCDTF